MIANVSPSIATFDDTYNTLKYANRAKNIKTQVTRNVTNAQYHISNYNQIIANLRTEISDLKNQLGKKDPNSNVSLIQEKNFFSNNPSKENKKEDNHFFEKAVKELKQHLQEEYLLQSKIKEQEEEIAKTTNFINSQHQVEELNTNKKPSRYSNKTLVNINTKNDGNITEIEETHRIQTEPNKDDINSDKENFNNNHNNDKFINLLEQNNSIQTDIDGELNNNIMEKELFLGKLKKSYERNSIRFSEMMQKKEILLNIYAKNGIKDYQFEYLKSLIKAHNFKFYVTESKEKDKLSTNLLEIKEDYIKKLEKQVRLRDEIMNKNNLEIVFEENEEIKSLENIKKEYSNKLPPIVSKNKSYLNLSNIKSVENNENEKNFAG